MFEQRRGKSFYYKLDVGHREGIFSHHDALAGLGAGAELGPSFSSKEGLGAQGWELAHISLPRWLREAPAGNDPQINLNKPGVEGGHAQSQHKLGSPKSELWALGTQTPGFTQQRGMPQPGCLLCLLNCSVRAANTRRRHHHPSWLHFLPTPMPPAFATHSALCSLQVCPELADSRIQGSGPPRRPASFCQRLPGGEGGGGRRVPGKPSAEGRIG